MMELYIGLLYGLNYTYCTNSSLREKYQAIQFVNETFTFLRCVDHVNMYVQLQ